MEEDISGEKAQEILEQNSHYNNFDVMEYREEEISQDKENIQQKGCDQNFESRKNLVKNDLFDLEAAVEGRGHSTRQVLLLFNTYSFMLFYSAVLSWSMSSCR